MRVVTAGGETIELGDVETTPTIGITDYSRRVTDDFGVTTVVERGFSRRMSVKLAVPFADVDTVQRRLAGLRATSALWVADDRFASLSVRGFYKDFDLDIATQPLSYCTLTVEGLAEVAAPADAGGDPAPADLPSTLQLLQPVVMTNSVLVASNVIENDAAEWAGATSYPIGARVMKAATHRIYESLVAANAGNDPAGASGKWLDVGPTNRWAMFDQALGTSTSSAGAIVVALDPGTAGAVALLDVVAGTVRVQANGYDRTLAAGAGAITFLDLPAAGQVTVTIAGPGTVSVGTLLIGRVVPLGITEASPTAGITDFSKKTVDDFGDVAIVERAWSKRMAAKALIRTDAIDVVANRIAAVRARPSLWIGQAGIDALTVYGFFKDFSIEVGETLSKLSLSIEGLSAAAKIEPLTTTVDWVDLTDKTGTKPDDNATVGAPAGTTVNDRPAESVTGDLDLNGRNWFDTAASAAAQNAIMLARTTLDGQTIGTVVTSFKTEFRDEKSATAETFSLLGAKAGDGQSWLLDQSTVKVGPVDGGSGPVQSLAERFQSINVAQGLATGSIDDLKSVLIDPAGNVTAKAVLALNANGKVAGLVATNTGVVSRLELLFDSYDFLTPSGTSIFFYADPAVGGDGKVHMPNVVVDTLEANSVKTPNIVQGAVSSTVSAVGGTISGITSDSGEEADGLSVSLISTGAPVRVDIAFEAYRVSGVGKLKAQLVCRRSGQADLYLSGQYNAPTSVDSPPVAFFIVSAVGTGAATFFVRFSVAGAGSWNVLTQTICATELKR